MPKTKTKRVRTLIEGIATTLPDGLVWAVREVEEQEQPGIVRPERVHLFGEVERVLQLHRTDAIPEALKPDVKLYPNFAHLLAVEDGRIVGYLASRVDIVDGALWHPRPLDCDLLVNVWLARGARGRGLAGELLRETLRRFPTITDVLGPLSPAGERLLASVAPDILARHLASLVPA